ncbi:cupin domain-containing protein [Streptomyces sp. SP18CS02]|uniref:cupin domain-containing protein n=1 Tax=Streptomyces sp. SP18CS02 TaxID=3002531 RepID=UPI002E7A7099|nr:cupin domain-containing protein [Streptomyces sp. SP18CS02]MEE1751553.1 cupin domain-containing protein [Streptomyces sp. SP18CS02]
MVERRILGPDDGELHEPEHACGDRFLIDSGASGGRFSVVEHRLPPHVLAAPVHKHTREDEFGFVLAGSVGAAFGDEEVLAGPGDLVFKPRDEWHTFWNAGGTPARLLEIISPGGLEELFRWLDRLTEEASPGELELKAATYGCAVDMEATMALIAKHGLVL